MKTIKARLIIIASTFVILLVSMLPSLLTGLVDSVGMFILAGLGSTCVITLFSIIAVPCVSWIVYGDYTELGDIMFLKTCDWMDNLDAPKNKIATDSDYINALKELETL